MRPEIVFTEKPRGYTVNGERVPSVTQVLGILDKPALAPWAAKLTVEGVCNLIKLSHHSKFELPDEPGRLKAALKKRRLDHYSFTSDSIDRGKAAHKALEDWINHRRVPILGNYPVKHRGYIRGLTKFLLEWQPQFLESEKTVASAVHGFAGTRDTVCVLEDSTHGRVLLDLKTSKEVYPKTQFPQLAAYELAGVECGEPATDRQGIVRIGADESYEVVWSCAEAADFLSVLEVYRRQQSLAQRAKES